MTSPQLTQMVNGKTRIHTLSCRKPKTALNQWSPESGLQASALPWLYTRSLRSLKKQKPLALFVLGDTESEHSDVSQEILTGATAQHRLYNNPWAVASGPITSGQIEGEKMETVADFIFLSSKITADSDCSHEIKRCLLLGANAMTNLDSILKSRDMTLPTKVHLVKAMVFPVVMYGCESWTIKKAEVK